MKHLKSEEDIIACIKEHGKHGASSTDISKALGIERHTLAKYLDILRAEGRITFKKVGMGKIWFLQNSPLQDVSIKRKETPYTGLRMVLDHILSTMPDGILVENENYEIEFMNNSLIKKFGNRVGEKCYKVIKERDEPCEKCPTRKILHKGNLASIRYRSEDSRGNFYDSIASPIRNPDGSIFVIKILRDMTDVRKAEEALQESEKMHRAIFESANDGIVALDSSGNIMSVNRIAEKISGYRKDEVLGKNIRELDMFSPESINLILENFSKRVSGIDIPPYEVEMTTKGGEKKSMEISATALRKGDKIVGDVAILRDITERKKAEGQIKYLNELKRSVIINSPIGILTGDKNGNIIHANPALIKILGSPSEEKTKSFNLLTLEALKRAGLDKLFGGVLSDGNEFDVEKEYVSHWGKSSFIRIKSLPLRDSRGEITGLIALIEDMTERKNLKEELNRLREGSSAPLIIQESRSISP